MSCLYITDQGAKISTSEGKVTVECRDGSKQSVPKETLESVMILGNATVTLPVQKFCL